MNSRKSVGDAANKKASFNDLMSNVNSEHQHIKGQAKESPRLKTEEKNISEDNPEDPEDQIRNTGCIQGSGNKE